MLRLLGFCRSAGVLRGSGLTVSGGFGVQRITSPLQANLPGGAAGRLVGGSAAGQGARWRPAAGGASAGSRRDRHRLRQLSTSSGGAPGGRPRHLATPPLGAVFAAGSDTRVMPVELRAEAESSYLAYAMSVIVGRALPDVRDGLKPVHRRILFAMHELGLASKKPYKKCARVVGEGLSENMLLADIDMDTVDYIPNFDESVMEPSVLPARIPHLLVNGSQGIAVGMATNIPPHNLGEVVDALCALIRNPNASVQELMEHCPGPDFPTGGRILGGEELLPTYSTGHGSLVLRGTVHMEQKKEGSRSSIIITEIPYQANKAALVERIATLADEKVLDVSDVRDESDRSGTRIVVEVKRGAAPLLVLNNMYKHTSLQMRFNCNMVGLVGGAPKEGLTLKDFLQEFLEFRCQVVERRARYQLRRASERNHLVEGLLVAQANMDAVVAAIRGAKDSAAAGAALRQEYGLTEAQTDGVLSMALRRITSLERGKLEEEHRELQAAISDLDDLLLHKKRVLEVVEKEAVAIKKEFGTPRRTVMEPSSNAADISDVDVIANDASLMRMAVDTFSAQRRGTSGKSGGRLKGDDALARFFLCRNHDYILFFSDRGIAYCVRAYTVPECSRTAVGNPINQLLPLQEGERITSVLSVDDFREDESLIMLTSGGFMKKTPLDAFASVRKSGLVAIQLEEGDELKWVRRAVDADSVLICSANGNAIRIACDKTQLRSMGRATRGVRAMKLKPNDCISAMDIKPHTPTYVSASTAPPGMQTLTPAHACLRA
eukprot:jgi/Mesen1/10340/ME000008S10125